MDDLADRQRLLGSAKALRGELIPRVTGPIDFRRSIRAAAEDTDGWCVKIANIEDTDSAYKYDLEVWYDTFSTRNTRRFWFGFSAPGIRAINSLFRKSSVDLQRQPFFPFDDSQLDEEAQKKMLRKPSPPTSHLSLEKYKSGGYSYFGVYSGIELDISGGVDFFRAVLLQLPEFEVDEIGDDYRAIENRRYVANHLDRERDAKLARFCKERDGFQCRVCGCRFEEEYGPLGKNFAEAHHIVPLSKLKDPITNSRDDLITVCSNCHRMLHRLHGEAGDVDTLKKAMREAVRRKAAAGLDSRISPGQSPVVVTHQPELGR